MTNLEMPWQNPARGPLVRHDAVRRQAAPATAWPDARRDASAPLVSVIDPDAAVRGSLQVLLTCAGFAAACFATAAEFLACARHELASCLLLDVSLPDADGLDLQKRLAAERIDLPIIFITSCTDIAVAVRAMKGGAVGFLTKPIDEAALLAALHEGLSRSEAAREEQAWRDELRERYTLLSCRERQVMSLVVAGLLNKQVAAELGISEITVKAHRGRVMQKMKAASLPGLVIMASQLGLPGPRR
jgi:FixJ family two-component response regulator